MSVLFGAITTVSIATIAITYAVGAEDTVEDTWFGALLAVTAFAGALGSLAAFVLAIVARVGHERSALLWLPLGVFPTIALFVALGEAFWWE